MRASQQSRGLLVELGLLESQSRVPRRNLNFAESNGGAGPFRSSAKGVNSAAAAAAVNSGGEARPPRFVKYSVTSASEPELAESSDEESSDEAVPGCARPSRRETVEALTLVPRERAQQRTVEQLVNWSREAWVQAAGQRSVYNQREFLVR